MNNSTKNSLRKEGIPPCQHKFKISKRTIIELSLVIFAGIISVFGYAPYDLWFSSLLGLTIFLWVLLQQPTPKKSALVTFFFTTSLNVTSLWWISAVMRGFGQMPLILATAILLVLACYLAIMPTLASWLAHKLVKNSLALRILVFLPMLWIIGDHLNSWMLTGFPWNQLGYTQIDFVLRNYAPLLGVEGITLAMFIICSGVAYASYRRKVLALLAPFVTLVIAFACGYLTFTDDLKSYRVALVQGNIATEVKWNEEQIVPTLQTYIGLMKSNLDTDLMIWPESAIPALENDTATILASIDGAMEDQNIGFITGVQYYNQDTKSFYNGMIGIGVIDTAHTKHYTYGTGNRYYKRHLVPVGEFVPLESVARALGPLFNMPMSSFSRGSEEQGNIEVAGLKVASAICYEITFNNEMRQQINDDTNLIVTVSNDGWFNNTNGPYQHLSIARMRALEFSKPVLRSTNNGITATIDKHGQVTASIPQNVIDVLKTEVTPTVGITPFAKFGRWPLLIIFAITFIVGMIWRTHNNKQ